MDEKLRELLQRARDMGATDDQLKGLIQRYESDKKKRESGGDGSTGGTPARSRSTISVSTEEEEPEPVAQAKPLVAQAQPAEPAPQAVRRSIAEVLNPAQALSQPLQRPGGGTPYRGAPLGEAGTVSEMISPATKFGRKVIMKPDGKEVLVDPRTIPVSPSADFSEDSFLDNVRTKMNTGQGLTPIEANFIRKNEMDDDDSDLQELAGLYGVGEAPANTDAEKLAQVRLAIQKAQEDINNQKTAYGERSVVTGEDRKAIVAKQERLDRLRDIESNISGKLTTIATEGRDVEVSRNDIGNAFNAAVEFVKDYGSLPGLLTRDKTDHIKNRIASYPPEFVTGLNFLGHKDPVEAERVARLLAEGHPISESQVATIVSYGQQVVSKKNKRDLQGGIISQEEYDARQADMGGKAVNNILDNQETGRAFFSSGIAEILDENEVQKENASAGGLKVAKNRLLGFRNNYNDDEIAMAARLIAKKNGMDFNDSRVQDIVKYLQTTEGVLPGQNSIYKSGLLTRDLPGGFTEVVSGLGKTVAGFGKTAEERYAEGQSEGNINVVNQKTRRVENSWEGTAGKMLNGVGQLSAQALLQYLTGGLVGGVGKALGGAKALAVAGEAAAAGEAVAGDLSIAQKVGGAILRNKDFSSTLFSTAAQSYDGNLKTAQKYTANDKLASAIGFGMSGLEAALEGVLSPLDIVKGIGGRLFKGNDDVAKGLIEILTDNAIVDKRSALSDYLKATIRSGVKGAGVAATEVGEELPTAIADYGANMILNPDSEDFKNRNFTDELKNVGIETGLTMALPALATGVASFNVNNFSKGSLIIAAQNRQRMQDALDLRLSQGDITQDDYNEKMAIVNTAAKAHDNLPLKLGNAALEPEEKADYIFSRVSEGILNKRLENSNDEAEKRLLQDKIQEQQDFRYKLLNNESVYATPPVVTGSEVSETAQDQAAQTGGEQGATNAQDTGVAPAVVTPAAEETTGETVPAEDIITVGDLMDKPVRFNGQRAIIQKDGNTIIAKIEGQNKEYEIGNVDEVSGQPIKEYGIEQEVSVVSVDDAGNFTVRGQAMTNQYSDPTQAINYDKDGYVTSVTLSTPDGKARTFRGDVGDEIAYQIKLKEISDNNETDQLEQFINEDTTTREEIDNAKPVAVTQVTATEDTGEVQRSKIERQTTTVAPAPAAAAPAAQQPDVKEVVYHAAMVDDPDALKQQFPPVHPNEIYHHSTIAFKPPTTEGMNIGSKRDIKVTGRLTTDKVDVLLVDNGTGNPDAHITLSTAEGVKPFESNAEIKNNRDKIVPVDAVIPATEGYFNGKEDVKTAPAAAPAATTPQATVTQKEATVAAEVKQGDRVTLPPQIKGGIPREMIYDDGEWKQDIGDKPSKVGKMVQDQAQAEFEATAPQVTVTKTEAAPVEAAPAQQGEVVGTHNGVDLLSINSAEDFHAAISEAMSQRKEDRLQADVHSVEKYQSVLDEGGQLFLSADGNFGGYLTPDGYMGSLFKNPSSPAKGVANFLQKTMVEHGGKFFDAYGTHLEDIYIKGNFRPVARMKFNEEFAQEGWEDSNLKTKPDVVFFAYDPTGEITKGEGKYFEDYDEAYTFAQEFKSDGKQTSTESGTERQDTGTQPQPITNGENVPTQGETESTEESGLGTSVGGEGTTGNAEPQGGQATSRSDSEQSIVNNTNKTQSFFSKTVNGGNQPKKKWKPIKGLSVVLKNTYNTWKKFRGSFDAHIESSIPAFRDVQIRKMNAIADVYKDGGLVIDLMGSEGGFGKTITTLNPKIKSINLDLNGDMQAAHERTPVENSEFVKQAFYEDVTMDDGTVAKRYVPTEKADVVHESMGFQFITHERQNFINEVADHYVKEDGVVILEEKLIPDTQKEWSDNENKKDKDFKSEYFTKEQMTKKAEEVLVGMKSNQTTDTHLQEALASRFKYVYQYWDAGNFKGYLASNNKESADRMLNAIGNTVTDFTTRPLVKIVDGEVQGKKAATVTKVTTPQATVTKVEPAAPAAEKGKFRLITATPVDEARKKLKELEDKIEDEINSAKKFARGSNIKTKGFLGLGRRKLTDQERKELDERTEKRIRDKYKDELEAAKKQVTVTKVEPSAPVTTGTSYEYNGERYVVTRSGNVFREDGTMVPVDLQDEIKSKGTLIPASAPAATPAEAPAAPTIQGTPEEITQPIELSIEPTTAAPAAADKEIYIKKIGENQYEIYGQYGKLYTGKRENIPFPSLRSDAEFNAALARGEGKTTTKATPTVEKTVAAFADRIASGEQMTSPEDLQFYENNKEAIEKELISMANQTSDEDTGEELPLMEEEGEEIGTTTTEATVTKKEDVSLLHRIFEKAFYEGNGKRHGDITDEQISNLTPETKDYLVELYEHLKQFNPQFKRLGEITDTQTNKVITTDNEKIKYVTSVYFGGFGRGSTELGKANDPLHSDLSFPTPTQEVLENINTVFDAKLTDTELSSFEDEEAEEEVKEAPVNKEEKIKKFNEKADKIANDLIDFLTPKTTRGASTKGASIASVVNGANEAIKKAYAASLNIREAVEAGVKYFKDNWDTDANGDLPEADVREKLTSQMFAGLTAKEVAAEVRSGHYTLPEATKGRTKDFVDEVIKFITGKKKYNFDIETFKVEVRKNKDLGATQAATTNLLGAARPLTKRQIAAIAEVYAETSDKEEIEKALKQAFEDIMKGKKPQRVLQKLSVSDVSALVAALNTLEYTPVSNESLEKIADQVVASIDINQADKFLNNITNNPYLFDAKQIIRAKAIVELQKIGNQSLATQLVKDMADEATHTGRQTQSLQKAYDILNAQGNAETKAAFKVRWAARYRAIAEAKFNNLKAEIDLKDEEIAKLNERIHAKAQKSSFMNKLKEVVDKICKTRTS